MSFHIHTFLLRLPYQHVQQQNGSVTYQTITVTPTRQSGSKHFCKSWCSCSFVANKLPFPSFLPSPFFYPLILRQLQRAVRDLNFLFTGQFMPIEKNKKSWVKQTFYFYVFNYWLQSSFTICFPVCINFVRVHYT